MCWKKNWTNSHEYFCNSAYTRVYMVSQSTPDGNDVLWKYKKVSRYLKSPNGGHNELIKKLLCTSFREECDRLRNAN
jgi:hypothetical protein